MTPFSLEVDIRIRGWGRIKKTIGSQDPREQASMREMLRLLGRRRRYDILEAIRAGELSLPYVFAMYEQDGLDRLPTGPALLPLIPAFESWLETHAADAHHRENQWSCWRKLKKHATSSSRLADLPRLLDRVRDDCVAQKTPAMFNRTRETVSAFLRDKVKRRHALYQDVRDIAPLVENPAKANPQTVAQVVALAEALGPIAGPMWWTLCRTGMRPKEYFQLPWELGVDRLVVHNAKIGGTRVVPMVAPPADPRTAVRAGKTQQRWFSDLVSKKSGDRVSPYHARDTFTHWCELVRIPRTRIDLYLGHGPKSMTDLYAWHDVTGFLEGDAELLRAHEREALAAIAAKKAQA